MSSYALDLMIQLDTFRLVCLFDDCSVFSLRIIIFVLFYENVCYCFMKCLFTLELDSVCQNSPFLQQCLDYVLTCAVHGCVVDDVDVFVCAFGIYKG